MNGYDFHCTDGHGLAYPGFSVVLMQFFSLDTNRTFDEAKACGTGFLSFRDKSIDHLIFIMKDEDRNKMKRYKLGGFDFTMHLDEPYPVDMWGKVKVETMILFDYVVSVTYRFVFDNSLCHLSQPVSTDHIIALLSTHLSAEHWSRNSGEEETNINLEISDFTVNGLPLGEDGALLAEKESGIVLNGCGRTFDRISERYKKFINLHCTDTAHQYKRWKKRKENSRNNSYRDFHYAMVDVWENVSHPLEDGSDLFANNRKDRLTEAQIVEHIMDFHKEELIGLMSLYPGEWPYRDRRAYDDVCGENIAIDTDDLVLVNSNVNVVIGTYGRRGTDSPVNWEEHLEERNQYHVSWPEYLMILEMVLAKKFIIDCVKEELVAATLNTGEKSSSALIAHNAELSMRLSRMVLQLDVVKYSKFASHKVMFDRTTRRLEIQKDMEELIRLMNMVDSSLHNLSDYKSMKSDFMLNFILALISVASTFEILFQDIDMPFLEYVGLSSSTSAAILVWMVAAVTCFGILLVVVNMLKKLAARLRIWFG